MCVSRSASTGSTCTGMIGRVSQDFFLSRTWGLNNVRQDFNQAILTEFSNSYNIYNILELHVFEFWRPTFKTPLSCLAESWPTWSAHFTTFGGFWNWLQLRRISEPLKSGKRSTTHGPTFRTPPFAFLRLEYLNIFS